MSRRVYAWIAGLALSSSAMAGEETIQLLEGRGKEIAATRCVTCHSLDYVQTNASVMDRAAWERSVRKMIDRFGAPISEEDARIIIEYLSAQYSKPH
jgi:sulfite dehydrogenase (cytochrome) subunit B